MTSFREKINYEEIFEDLFGPAKDNLDKRARESATKYVKKAIRGGYHPEVLEIDLGDYYDGYIAGFKAK